MKTNKQISAGLVISIVIFIIATFIGGKVNLKMGLILNSFLTHTIMLLLSIIVIYGLRNYVDYKISLPKFKKIGKPILFGILATIITNFSLMILSKALGEKIEPHPILTKMNPVQTFIFIFIYASVAEELLFRGFLLNILKPLNAKGIIIFKRRISLSVIISAIAFGLSHLILIITGVGGLFLVRVVIFTTLLGLIAGYYQEKNQNNAYAIIVHMAGNLIGVIGSIVLFLNS
jgi:membrane protease YdiL (CAAX protease family)